ncbi:MAG TPA: glycosyltransferase WbuB, partial [Candidatus Atribacteria bacterium]|nr:glycosyltransferase WbuB [Candidatus Atribacteria bacterium]
VLVLSNPPFISFHGLILKIFKKCKVIYNVQDLFPDLAVELGKLRNKPFIFVLKTLSKYIIRKMDKVIVVGECMEQKIREEVLKDGEADHIVTIHNWADGEKLKVIGVLGVGAEDNCLKREWSLEGKFVVLYSGNIGYLHEFDTIIKAAEDLRDSGYKDIVFVFIGEGIKKEYIRKKAVERGLNNILFFPYQARDKLTYSLGIADVSLVTLEKGFEGMVVPSKIYGILASGRPVIAVVGGESEIVEIIREGNCGEVVKIGDYQALVDGIINYYKDRKKCREDGLNGRRYFEENFDRKIATRKYIEVIEEVLKS